MLPPLRQTEHACIVISSSTDTLQLSSAASTTPDHRSFSLFTMHISIPVTEDLVDTLGGRYVLYSVYLDGFILFKVRYKDLHFWDEQMQNILGSRRLTFPPKYYLVMTKSMAEDRRILLEQYLQKVVSDPVISSSEIFITYLKKLQLETFNMPSVNVILKIFLPDGRQVNIDCKTSDSAERVLEAALYKLNLSRELVEYFSLFITHKDTKGIYSVVKRVAPFEIPFITIWNINNDLFQIDIRKWYMTPSTDAMLMGCTSAIDLLYVQAVQEFEMNWSRPTEQQRITLKELITTDNKVKFLELMQQVEHYSYQKLDPGLTDHLGANTVVTVSVGKSELYCLFQTTDKKTENLRLHISKVICWNVRFQEQEKDLDQQEFRFEYTDGDVLKWITIKTNQAFLLSTWLKKMLSEQPVTCTKGNLEIQDNRTSASMFTRKQKKVDVPEKKDFSFSHIRNSDSLEMSDCDL
ncbi:sorting nexin-31 [Hyla sarda]|uniref:sorting nexin-31 n=1 Tax=Hyla sarda TaxID=327740 RepID=UPI0024C3A544|nr:sorting nexin-31 [Hyla sarda]